MPRSFGRGSAWSMRGARAAASWSAYESGRTDHEARHRGCGVPGIGDGTRAGASGSERCGCRSDLRSVEPGRFGRHGGHCDRARGHYLSKGYGSAQLEHDIPITDRTVFHAASISKQFTAMAILLLEQEGKLSLDATVGQYLDWAPHTTHAITVRQLIFHTSGLRDMTDLLKVAGWH